ncbi:MAG: hypothetical protein E6X17_05885 [Sporomusaceae bacterium]|nr:hypothetical protein [Sporomusaceae bacterium]
MSLLTVGGAPTVEIGLDEFETEDIVQYLKDIGYIAGDSAALGAADLVREIEEKIPEAITFQTCSDDEYSVTAGTRKYAGKGCATIIVLPGR